MRKEGYGSGPRDVFFKCKPKRESFDMCNSSAECADGRKCCYNPFVRGYHCETHCTDLEQKCRLLACPAIATRPVAQINADMVRTQSLQDNARTKINECGWDLGLSVS